MPHKPQVIFNASCKTGQLQVDRTTVRVVTPFGRVIWAVPCKAITRIGIKKGALLADIAVSTAQGTFSASTLSRQNAEKFLALFPGTEVGALLPTVPLQPAQAPPTLSAPTPPYQPGQFQASPASLQTARRRTFQQWFTAQRRSTKVGLGCGFLIFVLLFCTIASVLAFSNTPSSSGAQATPTASHTQVGTLAQAKPTATPSPTVPPKPTPKPTPRPTPRPTQPPAPKPTPTPSCQGVNGNPWCYNFTAPGSLIYNPPSAFCNYFACIDNFWNGRGFVNECSDGSYSKSGGIRGDCSYHGGEDRPLYSH